MKKPLLLYLLFIFIALSCKTTKNTIQVHDQVKSSNKTLDKIIGNGTSIDWFDGKFNADINNDGKTNSVKGRVRIRKDSLIWISIKPDIAIIEVFRLLISPDSVQLIDYLNKKFFADKISAIKEFMNYNVSFDMVQNIFIGNPTLIIDFTLYSAFTNREGDDILAISDFKTYVDARNANRHANYLFQALWFKDKVHKRNLIYDPANKIELDLQYTEHEMVDSFLLPKTVQVTVIGDTTNTSFGFSYTKIQVNEVFEFPFSIPENYEQIFLKK